MSLDIFTHEPPRGIKYDTIYFDIWPTVSGDNVPQMDALKKKYRRFLRRPGGWMRCWDERRCRQLAAS